MSAALALLAIYGTFALMIIGFTSPHLFVTGARGLANLVIRGKASLSKLTTAKEKPMARVAQNSEKSLSGELSNVNRV